jgi:hypothetical protein
MCHMYYICLLCPKCPINNWFVRFSKRMSIVRWHYPICQIVRLIFVPFVRLSDWHLPHLSDCQIVRCILSDCQMTLSHLSDCQMALSHLSDCQMWNFEILKMSNSPEIYNEQFENVKTHHGNLQETADPTVCGNVLFKNV